VGLSLFWPKRSCVPKLSQSLIDVCLCLSALPFFLETNVVAILGVNIAGEQVVTDILTNLVSDRVQNYACASGPDTFLPQIIGLAPTSNCHYPDHSTPTCISGDPCGFDCTDGFTPFPASHPTQCKCKAPSVVCNGKCGPPGACPSGHATASKKRNWVGSGTCTEMGPGWLACGIPGGGPRAWECVNAARDLESCKWPACLSPQID
jgi:hypothetical protein